MSDLLPCQVNCQLTFRSSTCKQPHLTKMRKERQICLKSFELHNILVYHVICVLIEYDDRCFLFTGLEYTTSNGLIRVIGWRRLNCKCGKFLWWASFFSTCLSRYDRAVIFTTQLLGNVISYLTSLIKCFGVSQWTLETLVSFFGKDSCNYITMLVAKVLVAHLVMME